MNIHFERMRDLQKKLAGKKYSGLIVNHPKDLFFLTGFSQDRTLMLVAESKAFVFLPKMFVDHFKQTCNFAEIIEYSSNVYEELLKLTKKLKIRKVVFDKTQTSYSEGKLYEKYGFEGVDSIVMEFRMSKKGEELASVKKACSIAKKAFDRIKPKIKAGIKEIEVARELEYIMKKMGAMERSFETIVAFGPNSALPHHETSERKLKKNEVVLIDFGCIYKRYCSDMTRTFFYGKPTEEFLKVYSIVDKAQKEGVKSARAGVLAKDVDAVCRNIITESGYGQYFTHGTGHGVGLDIHELPYLNPRGETKLAEGMTVTVEPGIYLYGKFGVRIEDTIYITKNKPVVLTK